MAFSRSSNAFRRRSVWSIAGLVLGIGATVVGCGTTTVAVNSAPRAHLEAQAQSQEAATPAEGTPMAFEELLSFARANAPASRSAQSRLAETIAYSEGRAQVLPEYPTMEFGVGGKTNGEDTGVVFEVGVSQAFEIAGQADVRVNEASALADAELAQNLSDAWMLRCEVRDLYITLAMDRVQLAQAEATVDLAERIHAISLARAEAGDTSTLSTLVSEADLLEAKAELQRHRREAQETLNRLALTIGWPSGVDLVVNQVAETEPQDVPVMSSILAQAAESHPLVEANKQSEAHAQTQVELADAESWPNLELGLGYEREPGLGEEDGSHVLMVHFGIPLPFWTQNASEQAKARARLTSSQVETEITSNLIQTRIEGYQKATALALEEVETFRTGILPQLAEQLGKIETAFQLGEIGVEEVSLLQQRALEVAEHEIEARRVYFSKANALECAVGSPIWETK